MWMRKTDKALIFIHIIFCLLTSFIDYKQQRDVSTQETKRVSSRNTRYIPNNWLLVNKIDTHHVQSWSYVIN